MKLTVLTPVAAFSSPTPRTRERPGHSPGTPSWAKRGDREALPLLLTLSSGVKGLTTIHAGSAHQALTRLRFICQLAEGNELPHPLGVVRLAGPLRVSDVDPSVRQFVVPGHVAPAQVSKRWSMIWS